MFPSFVTGEHCWVEVSLLATGTPRPFSAKYLPSHSTTACNGGAWGCSSPGTGLHASLWWTSWGSCWSISLDWTRFLWMAEQPPGAATTYPSFVPSANLLRMFGTSYVWKWFLAPSLSWSQWEAYELVVPQVLHLAHLEEWYLLLSIPQDPLPIAMIC